jgi:hypothetical protein
MDRNAGNESLEEIREIITGLKAQADMTQSMRMTVPLSVINKLYDLWSRCEATKIPD